MEKEIVCVVLNENYKLEKVGLIDSESGDKKLSKEVIPVSEVINEMNKNGTKFFFKNEENKKIYLEVYAGKIRTEKDGRYDSELKELRSCRLRK